MITIYTGTCGSGKSLHIAHLLYLKLQYGIPCICNFRINTDNIPRYKGTFTYLDNSELTPQYLINYSIEYFKHNNFREDKILLCIDECQILFNCREWGNKNRDEWVSFFTQHRKFGYQIILIAQFDRMVDRQIRSVIEYQCIHRKVSNFGIKGQIINLLAGTGLFVSVKMWYPMKEKVDVEYFKYRKRYNKIYDTYAIFSNDTCGNGDGA